MALMGNTSAKVSLRDGGILHVDLRDIQHIRLEHMHDIYLQHKAISNQKLPILFTGNNIVGYDREAVQFVSSPEIAGITRASAIITRSLLEQYLGRMFIWYNKPPLPGANLYLNG